MSSDKHFVDCGNVRAGKPHGGKKKQKIDMVEALKGAE